MRTEEEIRARMGDIAQVLILFCVMGQAILMTAIALTYFNVPPRDWGMTALVPMPIAFVLVLFWVLNDKEEK